MSWSILGVLLLAGITVWLLSMLRDIFPPMALALIIIVLLNPMVAALEKSGIPRWLGTTAIYLVAILAITIAISFLAPPLGRQVNGLVERWPEIRRDGTQVAERLASRVGLSLEELGINSGSDPEPPPRGSAEPSGARGGDAGEGVPSFVQTLRDRLFAGAGRFATGALHVVINFILAPVIALYLLIDLPKIQKAFLHYLPPRYRGEWVPLLDRAGKAVGGFFRGQLFVAAVVGVLSSLALALIDLPFWLPLGLLVGFFNIIPLVGPFVGGSVAVVVGGVTGGLGLAFKAGLVMIAVQQLDNHFISPKVMGRALRLHPVAVILALLAGGTLGGIWGMLLAVPGLGVAKLLAVHFYETRVLGNADYHTTITAGARSGADEGLPEGRPAQLDAAATEADVNAKETQPEEQAPEAGNDGELEDASPPAHQV
ncbi:MAG TPA: AI-2E family transporter [Actinomycetota bacterium]|nr:AI-2E family transporter [Actinomycetota bacterium]